MKILSSEEIRKADAYTIKHKPIRSIRLMERAARACVNWLTDPAVSPLFRREGAGGEAIKIFCGLGNNGGDGLAIARLLAAKKFKVEVFIIRYSNKCSDDFLVNEKCLKKIKEVKIHNITSSAALPLTINHYPLSIIVDALFGSGLNKPVEGLAAEAISYINKSRCPVVAIDIPSGLFSDKNDHHKDVAVVRATHVLTFESPKLAFMFPENEPYVGAFSVLDIGLDEGFISSLPSKNYFVREIEAHFLYKKRTKFSHKGTFGHALIVAGSYGKMGACVLASRACLSAGAGLVTVHISKCGYDILQTANPEVMVEVDSEEKMISDNIKIDKYNAIGIGPGIGTEKETQNLLKVLIQNSSVPLVLDADALNILAENKTWLSFLPVNSILTPHPGEFKRLVGEADNDFERLQLQKEFSIKHGVYVTLKGAHTCISCPDGEVYFNSTGNPGMATAGSGDVLTGIITGLLAQGYDSKKASVLGVYLHGLAGDIATQHLSEESMIAGNIVEFMGEAFRGLSY
ncbi:MAG: NAD(P)H-hydrate dehydratase [Bacteroidetes bacterium]|nr:MAG: NAD(P)H-hydrate dehydratase [Bacteroidota bacterium]